MEQPWRSKGTRKSTWIWNGAGWNRTTSKRHGVTEDERHEAERATHEGEGHTRNEQRKRKKKLKQMRASKDVMHQPDPV